MASISATVAKKGDSARLGDKALCGLNSADDIRPDFICRGDALEEALEKSLGGDVKGVLCREAGDLRSEDVFESGDAWPDGLFFRPGGDVGGVVPRDSTPLFPIDLGEDDFAGEGDGERDMV